MHNIVFIKYLTGANVSFAIILAIVQTPECRTNRQQRRGSTRDRLLRP